ncbi:LysR family transcriptional regulator [Labrenzia sp. DG1229]|uniref:LysR family transcriptional regulator n=1 Tax=Labrenzia sp. DG1229 TaxID=681847 RepID=UPI000A020676|nr:LysR family transcriptional regulator [Labrenzia sp. DG1229]
MQTRSLRSLVRIAKIGSFARTAEQLNMTLSALSMQIKALETELGVDLFDRSVRPPRLTPIGRSIVNEAIPLLHCEESLLEICRPTNTLVGRFRVGFVTTAAVRLLPKFLKNAQSKAPHAAFEFETGLSKTLQTKVVNGQIDAAVVTDADGLPDALSGRIIREEPLVFAAHEDLLANGLEGLLMDHSFFHFMPDTGIGKLIAAEMATHDRPRSANTVMLDNLEAIMECVTAGLGFTLLPEPDVQRYRSGSVQTVPSPKHLRRKLVLATATDGTLAKRETALASLLGVTLPV